MVIEDQDKSQKSFFFVFFSAAKVQSRLIILNNIDRMCRKTLCSHYTEEAFMAMSSSTRRDRERVRKILLWCTQIQHGEEIIVQWHCFLRSNFYFCTKMSLIIILIIGKIHRVEKLLITSLSFLFKSLFQFSTWLVASFYLRFSQIFNFFSTPAIK